MSCSADESSKRFSSIHKNENNVMLLMRMKKMRMAMAPPPLYFCFPPQRFAPRMLEAEKIHRYMMIILCIFLSSILYVRAYI